MTPRDRRALLVGGAILVVAVLALRVLPWAWSGGMSEYRRLVALRAHVGAGRAELQRLPLLEDSTRLLAAAVVSLAPRLIPGSSGPEAVAAFQGYLQQLSLAHSARLERMAATPDSARAGPLRRATVEADFETDVRGLAGLLGALTRGELLAEVTQVRVTGLEPEAAPAGPEILRISVRVRAWYRQREGA